MMHDRHGSKTADSQIHCQTHLRLAVIDHEVNAFISVSQDIVALAQDRFLNLGKQMGTTVTT